MDAIPLDLSATFENGELATTLVWRVTGLPLPAAHSLVLTTDSAALAELLTTRGARVVREAGETLRVTGATSDDVGQLARDHGLTLLELSTLKSSLEQRYMELTRDAVDYRTAGALSSEEK